MGFGGATWDIEDENMEQPDKHQKSCWADWQPAPSCKDEFQPWDNLGSDNEHAQASPRGNNNNNNNKRSPKNSIRKDSDDSNGTSTNTSTTTGPPTPNTHTNNSNNNGFQRGGASKGKIFVGGLPSTSTKEDLREYFCRFGSIVDCVVMFDRDQRHRGFGFVTFSSPEDKDAVMAMYDKHFINRKWVEVKQCIPKDNIDLMNASPKNTNGGGKNENANNNNKSHRRSRGTESSSRLSDRTSNGNNFPKDSPQDHSQSPVHHSNSPTHMGHQMPVGEASPHGNGPMSHGGMINVMRGPVENQQLAGVSYGQNQMYRSSDMMHQHRMENGNMYPEMMEEKMSEKGNMMGMNAGYYPPQMGNMVVVDPSNGYHHVVQDPTGNMCPVIMNKMEYDMYNQGYNSPQVLMARVSQGSCGGPMSPQMNAGMMSPHSMNMSPMGSNHSMDFGHIEQQAQNYAINMGQAGPFGDSPRVMEENNW